MQIFQIEHLAFDQMTHTHSVHQFINFRIILWHIIYQFPSRSRTAKSNLPLKSRRFLTRD